MNLIRLVLIVDQAVLLTLFLRAFHFLSGLVALGDHLKIVVLRCECALLVLVIEALLDLLKGEGRL